MINCPSCKSKTKVKDSRGDLRTRECTSCKKRFKTVEAIQEEDNGMVEVSARDYEAFLNVMQAAKRNIPFVLGKST